MDHLVCALCFCQGERTEDNFATPFGDFYLVLMRIGWRSMKYVGMLGGIVSLTWTVLLVAALLNIGHILYVTMIKLSVMSHF